MIFDKLNDISTVRGLIIASVSIFEEAVDSLINRVFRKRDFVVGSVVESLFETSGPLAALNIRLKVLYGLGVIDDATFEDINHFLELKEKLNNSEKELLFFDPFIIEFLQDLQNFQDKSLLHIEPDLGDPDSLLSQMKAKRQEQQIHSSLILIVSNIFNQLQIESPL